MDLANDYKLILENIEGLVVIDKDRKIVFITSKLARSLNLDSEGLIGQDIKFILPRTTMDLALETGKIETGFFYFLDGETTVCTRVPLYREGRLAGALEYDIFENVTDLHNFLDNINYLSGDVGYGDELKKVGRKAKYSIEDIVGDSNSVKELKLKISKAAKTNSTVLIHGETGSGKEIVAHAIHKLSTRSLSNFIRINCATIPSELMESELFGYEEGTFTGAKKGGKKGRIEVANGGTIFFDEINQLPLNIQPKLLRFLQEREIDKLGGAYSIPVDVRVIAASNVDLLEAVEKGIFREDLLYRLNVVEVCVPPLRERTEDIPLLVEHFVRRLNDYLDKQIRQVSEEVYPLLKAYNWPGNIRELLNIVERAMNNSEGKQLGVEDFDQNLLRPVSKLLPACPTTEAVPTMAEQIRVIEKDLIEKAMINFKGNKAAMARALGISRPRLYQKIKELDIVHK